MLLRNVLQMRNMRLRPNMIQKRTFIGDFMAKYSQGSIVTGAMEQLVNLHEVYHIPWWSEILLITLGFRTLVTLPLMINQKKIFQRYEKLGPELEDMTERLRRKELEEGFVMGRNRATMAKRLRRQVLKETRRIMIRDNCSPQKAATLPLLQIPVWVTLSYSYRNFANLMPNPDDPVAHIVHSQLQNEGTLWFTNLTVPDPTGILPIATGLLMLLNIQMYVIERKQKGVKDSMMMKVFTNGARVLSCAFMYIGILSPANVVLYWFSSAIWGVGQNVAFRNKKVMDVLGFEDSFYVQKIQKEAKALEEEKSKKTNEYKPIKVEKERIPGESENSNKRTNKWNP